MPRTKTKTPNRRKLKLAREELRKLPPEQREELRYNGIGPGDSYVGMWRILNRDRHCLEQVERRMGAVTQLLGADRLSQGRRLSDQQRKDLQMERVALEEKDEILSQRVLTTYGKLLLHEKPRLQSIEVKGDPTSPMQMQVSLKGLSDEELRALARILPKLGGGG